LEKIAMDKMKEDEVKEADDNMDEEDNSRLDALAELVLEHDASKMAQQEHNVYVHNVGETSRATDFVLQVEEDEEEEWYTQAVDEAEAAYYSQKILVVEQEEDDEWLTQAVDEIEAAYYRQKVEKAKGVVVEACESDDDDLLPGYVSG
jgi:hypothetical protein